MRLLVFVKVKHRSQVTNVHLGKRGTGIADKLGNKGGIAASLQIYDTTLVLGWAAPCRVLV